ncbi:MAG: ubiquitin-like domain-containing protein [Promethearchaeota archaeon]
MFENEFDEDLEELEGKTPKVSAKTPAATVVRGKQIGVFFQSTIGPGEKKEKIMVNTGNVVGDIKTTVGNMFGLSPEDFHLSYGGVTMEESNPLADYKVENGAI